jgi:hypothetical protein
MKSNFYLTTLVCDCWKSMSMSLDLDNYNINIKIHNEEYMKKVCLWTAIFKVKEHMCRCHTSDMHLIKNVGVVEFILTQISGLLIQRLENYYTVMISLSFSIACCASYCS